MSVISVRAYRVSLSYLNSIKILLIENESFKLLKNKSVNYYCTWYLNCNMLKVDGVFIRPTPGFRNCKVGYKNIFQVYKLMIISKKLVFDK